MAPTLARITRTGSHDSPICPTRSWPTATNACCWQAFVAHVHPPMGMQDAVNLGWKLAEVIKRTASESLLDSYHAVLIRPDGHVA
ncbi:FAD-dependent monooxygenase [Ralstonia holmesii]|uniref:FAD-dependent monooxygenase n=1 Tax=Ralstonia holmesii TaxID=3058602 RepID=UPI003D64A315